MEANRKAAERVYRVSRNETRAYEELIDKAFCRNGFGHDSQGAPCADVCE